MLLFFFTYCRRLDGRRARTHATGPEAASRDSEIFTLYNAYARKYAHVGVLGRRLILLLLV